MQPETIKQLIEAGLPGVEARVTGDGSHFDAIVVGELFSGCSPVNRQRLVYGTLGDRFATGEIHALTIKAHTPEEWQRAQRLSLS